MDVAIYQMAQNYEHIFLVYEIKKITSYTTYGNLDDLRV